MGDNTLPSVIAGVLIGLAGGWLGPWLLRRRKKAAEYQDPVLQKYDDLVKGINARQLC
jgi:hypothetical protein